MKKYNLISIILKGFDSSILDNSMKKIVTLAKQERVKFYGPIPLPSKKQIFTVLRSPHVDKKSMDQFSQKVHIRLFKVFVNSEFFDAISKIDLHSGIDVKIKIDNKKTSLFNPSLNDKNKKNILEKKEGRL